MSEEKETKTEFDENPKFLDGVPDLSMLIHIEMKMFYIIVNIDIVKCPVLYINGKHFNSNNPYNKLPIYGQDVINQFYDAQKKKGHLPKDRPHPYAVAARAYMRMIEKRNQSVIVCGESGAGKVCN